MSAWCDILVFSVAAEQFSIKSEPVSELRSRYGKRRRQRAWKRPP
jgi:hypothetical protein